MSPVTTWLRSDSFGSLRPKKPRRHSTALVAERFDAWTYTKTDPRSRRLGSVRAGRVLWGTPELSGHGCKGGWYALEQGGYACASGSFRLRDSGEREEPQPESAPALDAALPYTYVRVTTEGAPRYHRMPTPEHEVAAWAGQNAPGSPLDVRMVGDYFLAVAGSESDAGRRFYRTLRGKLVRAEDVTATAPSSLHGAKDPVLPLAFVIDDEVPVYRVDTGELQPVGTVARYARFALENRIAMGGDVYVVGGDGLAVAAESVRVARATPRPAGVGASEKWIAVDLSQQTLLAYEGDTPVLATLVSSGKPGHETPTGAYRVRHKHVSTTMRGHDPVDGPYEVEEVPWTQYYSGGFALHGAYWHDDFGRVRSHGCTNLAPADARWLLRWTDPPLPEGWHSIRARAFEDGTRVYVSE